MVASYISGSSTVNGLLGGTSAILNRGGLADTSDVLLAFIAVGHTSAVTSPNGWTEIAVSDNQVLAMQTRAYWRRIPDIDIEPLTYTWTFASGAFSAVLEVWRGVGFVYLADQTEDLIALLNHGTPTLNNQIADSVGVACFTGASVLALGW